MVHPEVLGQEEIQVFNAKNGIFDVTDCLGANIGLWGAWVTPSCGVEHNLFQVAGIQKDYRGDIVYRVTGDWDKRQFGYPVDPSEVRLFYSREDAEFFLTEREAIE